MKKIFSLIASLIMISSPAAMAEVSLVNGRIPVSDIEINRVHDKLMLSMDLDLTSLKMGKDRQIMLIPVVYNADSTISSEFHPVYIAGHNLYYKHLRDEDIPGNRDLYKQGKVAILRYTGTVDDAEWINDSRVSVYFRVGGCCDETVCEGVDVLARLIKPIKPEFKPNFNYVSPQGNADKTREINGRAFVDFPVNKIVIYPEYRKNEIELAKIIATIDSVRNDKDITIDAISIKGFASPEGPYDHNIWLAQNRTLALKTYVSNLYHFDKDFISTSYEPEDWEGLRDFVKTSGLEHRQQILDIIDSDLAPDPKNSRIQTSYPAEYDFLLKTVYPGLRHSDYKIDYTIRQFTTVDEILNILVTAPQKLSVGEFYIAAKSMEPGSPEFNNVFETAVRMYPDDPVANINAANAAMARGDYKLAKIYLGRAGDDPSAIYARGLLEAFNSNYSEAEQLLSTAAKLQVADAPEALRQVRAIVRYNQQQADPDYKSTYINLN